MYCITCHKINCPTPHFYVNPKGGKIPLITVLDSPDTIKNLPGALAVKLASVHVMDETKDEPDKFSKEDIEIIREWYKEMQEQIAQDNTGITVIEESPDVVDYLVVQCESNHKNYIPLIKNK